jgi:hypothetical protein
LGLRCELKPQRFDARGGFSFYRRAWRVAL